MTIKSSITRKVTNALLLASLLAGSMAVVNSTPVSASSNACGVGYSLQNGKCKPVTTQRKIVAKVSAKMTKIALCLSKKNMTLAQIKACGK
jgi:fructose-specific phosphotransferase system IIC component